MVSRKEIRDYHAKEGIENTLHKIGIELELFCINSKTLKNVPYQTNDGNISIQRLFEHLKTHEGYASLDSTKTFGVQKGESKIGLEPGSQFELSSTAHKTLDDLLQDFRAYIGMLQRLSHEFHVNWLDVAYFPVGKPSDLSLLPSPRYEIMDGYWQKTGNLGRDLMRYTVSVQVSFDYASVSDLEEKVSRALLLKPILLFITANSRLRAGKDTGLRSFRTMTYQNTDSARMGTPGPEHLWQNGRWTLDDYIDKVLKAHTIFTVGSEAYTESSHEPFEAHLPHASLADYLFHNSTIFTDVRVRQYMEVRYLDNPGISMLPGLVTLLHSLIYNDAAWQAFKERIPYRFEEVPQIVDLLNAVTVESDEYWEGKLLKPIECFIRDLQTTLHAPLAKHLDVVLNKVVNYKEYDRLPDLSSNTSVLSHFTRLFEEASKDI